MIIRANAGLGIVTDSQAAAPSRFAEWDAFEVQAPPFPKPKVS